MQLTLRDLQTALISSAATLLAGNFQDVTMRLIAERLLPIELQGATFLQGEVAHVRNTRLPSPRRGFTFHVYCSPLIEGTNALMQELVQAFVEPTETLSGSFKNLQEPVKVQTTERLCDLPDCECFLVYLNSLTWTSGERSTAFAAEVKEAMRLGVRLLLAHEMPGIGGQAARHGVDFSTFFACSLGATPPDLLKRGIYTQIAVPLKGGAWREASMVMLAKALAEDPKEHDRQDQRLSMRISRQTRGATTAAEAPSSSLETVEEQGPMMNALDEASVATFFRGAAGTELTPQPLSSVFTETSSGGCTSARAGTAMRQESFKFCAARSSVSQLRGHHTSRKSHLDEDSWGAPRHVSTTRLADVLDSATTSRAGPRSHRGRAAGREEDGMAGNPDGEGSGSLTQRTRRGSVEAPPRPHRIRAAAAVVHGARMLVAGSEEDGTAGNPDGEGSLTQRTRRGHAEAPPECSAPSADSSTVHASRPTSEQMLSNASHVTEGSSMLPSPSKRSPSDRLSLSSSPSALERTSIPLEATTLPPPVPTDTSDADARTSTSCPPMSSGSRAGLARVRI